MRALGRSLRPWRRSLDAALLMLPSVAVAVTVLVLRLMISGGLLAFSGIGGVREDIVTRRAQKIEQRCYNYAALRRLGSKLWKCVSESTPEG